MYLWFRKTFSSNSPGLCESAKSAARSSLIEITLLCSLCLSYRQHKALLPRVTRTMPLHRH